MMGLVFAGFGIKMILKKDYVFKKQCSTIDPKTGKRMGCVCGSSGACHNKK